MRASIFTTDITCSLFRTGYSYYPHGSKLLIGCKPNYKFQGDAGITQLIECESGGKWSNDTRLMTCSSKL